MIEERMNQMPCSLRGEFCAKNLLCDRESMSEIENNHDELIWPQSHVNIGRSREIPDKVSSVADLLPMHLNKSLPNAFVSKSSSFKLSSKHDPIGICNDVCDCVSHLSQTLFGGWLLFEHGAIGFCPAVLLFADHSKEKLLLTIEVGIKRTS